MAAVIRFVRATRAFARPAAQINRRCVRTVFNFGSSDAPEIGNGDDVFKKVKHLHETVLKPLNTRYLGPLEKASDDLLPLPMVFVCGNHSSGKSSFINYVLGKTVQTTGVAPTDDGFTVIAPGTEDIDQDGPSLVGDPHFGFGGLRQYGTALINHVQLRIRKDTDLEGICIIDSPGMIDSPVQPDNSNNTPSTVGTGNNARTRDRGYDFSATMKWFAERADVILLFQDPAKPGTTGETLTIMTTALLGQDYKTFIILNKADQFATVHDFARAYGALCWNLSKVIPRKDLPRIYTMCVPVPNPTTEGGVSVASSSSSSSASSASGGGSGALREALPDLEATRNEIIGEVKRASARRVDNLITRLYDSSRLLKMHATVLNAVRKDYYSEVFKAFGLVAAGSSGFATLAATLLFSGSIPYGAALGGLTIAGTALGSWAAQRHLSQRADYYIEGPGLDEAFRRVHFLQLAEKDEFISQLWERVRPGLQTCLRTVGIRSAPGAKRGDLQALDSIIDKEVPILRRAASKLVAVTAGSASKLSLSASGLAKRIAAGASSSGAGGEGDASAVPVASQASSTSGQQGEQLR